MKPSAPSRPQILPKPSPLRVLCLRVIAGLGLVVSVYLLWQHVNHAFGREAHGLCKAAKAFDCSKIESSAFSSVAGIPMAAFGVFFFLVFLFFLILARPAGSRAKDFWSFASLLSLAGLGMSAALAGISAWVVRAFCLGCVAVYGLNVLAALVLVTRAGPMGYLREALGGFGAMFAFASGGMDSESKVIRAVRRPILLIVLGAAVVHFVALPLGLHFFRDRWLMRSYESQTEFTFVVEETALAHGSASAPVQIVYFTDFQCGHCKEFSHELGEILEGLPPDQCRVVYKHFPLNKECNPLAADQTTHPYACTLAAMAQQAGEMGKFWEMRGELYCEPKEDCLARLREAAARHQIDFEQWRELSGRRENLARVIQNIAEAAKIGLAGVPGVFINGKLSPSLEKEDLRKIIKAALKGKR